MVEATPWLSGTRPQHSNRWPLNGQQQQQQRWSIWQNKRHGMIGWDCCSIHFFKKMKSIKNFHFRSHWQLFHRLHQLKIGRKKKKRREKKLHEPMAVKALMFTKFVIVAAVATAVVVTISATTNKQKHRFYSRFTIHTIRLSLLLFLFHFFPFILTVAVNWPLKTMKHSHAHLVVNEWQVHTHTHTLPIVNYFIGCNTQMK